MKFVQYKLVLYQDYITIRLNRPCKCKIALAEITMAEINNVNSFDVYDNSLEITCDQINSTFDNPSRLLKRVPFSKLEEGQYYHTWCAKFLQMEEVDSEDKFLTIRIKRSCDGTNLILGNMFDDKTVYLTLAFADSDAPVSWSTYI